jgi:hypothetical protein
MAFHDSSRNSTVTNLTYATSAGTAVSTAGFGTQTYYISLTASGTATTIGGVRYFIGKAAVATTTNGALLLSTGRKLSRSLRANNCQPSAMTASAERWLLWS